MNNNNIYVSLAVSFIICTAMLLSFLFIIRNEYRPIFAKYSTDINVQLLKNDSILDKKQMTLEEYTQRVDSMCEKIKDFEQHYQHDIDLMIYKTDQWLGVWLGFIGIVVGFFSVLQFYNLHHADDKFSKMKEEFDKALDDKMNLYKASTSNYLNFIKKEAEYNNSQLVTKLESSITESKTKLENLINESNNQFKTDFDENKRQLNEVTGNVEKRQSEESINALMACISSFPDPQMLPSKSDKKVLLSYFMKILYKDFENYIKQFDAKDSKTIEDKIPRLVIVLNTIKFAAMRSQNIYSEYHQNVTFYRFLNDINSLMGDLALHKQVKELSEKLQILLNDFNDMIVSIAPRRQ